LEGKEWNDSVSEVNHNLFLDCVNDLNHLKLMTIPCLYSLLSVIKRQLFGYCDASTVAYCAVVYMRTISSNDRVETLLMCSKTEVAPIPKTKSMQGENSIHRLELLGAFLLSKLINRLSTRLNIELNNILPFPLKINR